jgi:hypothetical protein
MTMPGFSAEASLYETTESYRVVGAGVNPTTELLPAFDGAHQLSCWEYRAYVCEQCSSTGAIWACEQCGLIDCFGEPPEF